MPSERFRARTWPQPSSSAAGPSTYMQSRSVAERLAQVDQELDENAVEMQLGRDKMRDGSIEVATLEERRAQLLEERQTLTAPIMRLPYELLARIFEMGNEADDTGDWVETVPKDDEEDEVQFPTAISQVNRRFRDVATTTQSLWSHICMREHNPWNLTRLWLERTRLIDVDLDLNGEDRWMDPNEVRAMLGVIGPPSRWRSFSLRTDDYLGVHAALSMMSEPAPELEYLELINAHTEFDEDEPLPSPDVSDIFGGDAPNLSQVSLYSVPLRWTSPMLAGLKVLELEYLPVTWRPKWEEWVNLIRASPELVHLTVMASGPHIPEEVEPRMYPEVEEIMMSKLEHLELGDVRPWVLSHLINMLRAPNLIYLSLDTLQDYDFTEQIRLISDARYPLLRRLKFVLIDLSESEFVGLLRRLPLLEQLELNAMDMFINEIMNDDLDPARTAGLVVPKLHTLWATGYNGHLLSAFVEQRKRLGGTLSTVLVPYRDEKLIHGEHLAYLRREASFGYFEGSDREQGDEDDGDDFDDGGDGSEWDDGEDPEYEEEWLDGLEEEEEEEEEPFDEDYPMF